MATFYTRVFSIYISQLSAEYSFDLQDLKFLKQILNVFWKDDANNAIMGMSFNQYEELAMKYCKDCAVPFVSQQFWQSTDLLLKKLNKFAFNKAIAESWVHENDARAYHEEAKSLINDIGQILHQLQTRAF